MNSGLNTRRWSIIELTLFGIPAIYMSAFQIFQFNNIPVYVNVVVVAILIASIIIKLIRVVRSNARIVTLPSSGKQFTDYFSNWYKKNGVLTICCSDLKWIADETNKDISDSLILKAKERGDDENPTLTVWLPPSQINSARAQDLKNAGADIQQLPSRGLDSLMNFSLRDYNGVNSCIFRYKVPDTEKLTIHIHNSNAYTDLLVKICESFK